MVNLKIGKNDEGNTEYYLTELETYENFEQVISEAVHQGVILIDQLDGIYSRTALFGFDERKFKIIFHEDVGIYAFSVSKLDDDEWLHQILKRVVEQLNKS